MAERQNKAWVVLVPNDDEINAAILSAVKLCESGTSACIVALASNLVSSKGLSHLNRVAQAVFVAENSTLDFTLDEKERFLLSALKMTFFSKIVILNSGTIVCEQMDHIFETDQEDCKAFLSEDSSGYKMFCLTPDLRTYEQLANDCTGFRKWILKAEINPNFLARTWKLINSLDDWNDKKISGICQVENGLAKEILKNISSPNTLNFFKECTEQNWIAIVGMSCRFPQANSLNEYWNILENGLVTASHPPTERIPLVNMDPTLKANFLKCAVDNFDTTFFEISPSEAALMDPQGRLLLEVSWEAFEDASINPELLKGSNTGIFYAAWQNTYKDALNENHSGPHEEIFRKYLGCGFGSTGAKLSYFYGFSGPNISIETGCSASLVAVDLATKSLLSRECPIALACGANLILHMGRQAKVLAEDGLSKTFDAAADGYARGEGITVLILKRYKDALEDGNKIHGIIRGVASSQEGLSKSFGTPTVDAEYTAMHKALKNAGVDPFEIDYVEAHATGTAVGDPIEANAIVKAYSSQLTRDKPLFIGSGKTNIGHTEACSGIAGIIKVILSMQHEIIPRHVNLTNQNPGVDFSSIPGIIPLENVSWPRNSCRPRIAGISSFGITGTDVHLILQEPPKQKVKGANESGIRSTRPFMLPISAKSIVALNQISDLFQNEVQDNQKDLADICYTASVCRPHHQFRRVLLANNQNDMLENFQNKEYICSGNLKSGTLKICFVFPGKMPSDDFTRARKLYESYFPFKQQVDECNTKFQKLYPDLFPTFSSILASDPKAYFDKVECSAGWLAVLRFGFMITCHYALAKLWMRWGIQPTAILGHCMGEITGSVVCGALKLEEAYKLLAVFPTIYQAQELNPGAVMILYEGVPKVNKLIRTFQKTNPACSIEIVIENSSAQTAVGGPPNEISFFQAFCTNLGTKCQILISDFCAHSKMLIPAAESISPILNKLEYQPIQVPFVSSTSGNLVQNSELCTTFWKNLLTERVQYPKACSTIEDMNLGDTFIEMGFSGALTKLTEENLSSNCVCLASLPKPVGIWKTLAELYRYGANIDWKCVYDDAEQYTAISLPHYPFQRKSCWFSRDRKQLQNSPTIGNFNHSLLGNCLELSLENPLIFQNNWMEKLIEENNLFIRDHIIGNSIIFPGTGYLEMFLAAWQNSNTTNNLAVMIKNLNIHSPLLLHNTATKRIQCMVNKESGLASVYSSPANRACWKLHASAEILIYEEYENNLNINIQEICTKLDIQKVGEENAKEFYYQVARVGLAFGKRFKSIKRICTTESGDTLAEIDLQDETEQFVCHPILSDALLQTFIFHSGVHKTEKLYVPVRIREFAVIQGKTGTSKKGRWYVICSGEKVALFTSEGNLFAEMNGIKVTPTSVNSVIRAAGEDHNQIDNPVKYYQDAWQQSKLYQTGNCSDSIVNNPLPHDTFNCVETVITTGNSHKLDHSLDKLAQLYIFRALHELGWKQNSETAALNTEIIIPGLLRAFKYYNSIAAKRSDNIPNLNLINSEITEILKTSWVKDYAPLDTLALCGSNIANILQGKVTAHQLLFDENKLAEQYYKTSRLNNTCETMKTVFTEWMNNIQRSNRIVKILEVGAGTGCFTKQIISVMHEMGVKFEYHFTDVAPTLVTNASDYFENDDQANFIYEVLNIEKDPLIQGFPPEYFDVVVAFQVLHATKNLSETMENIAKVTRTGGQLILGEFEKPVLEIDVIFGCLESFWKFEDDRVANGHCVVNHKTWLSLMATYGFDKNSRTILQTNGYSAVMTATKSHHVNVRHGKTTTWLVFQPVHNEVVFLLQKSLNDLGRNVEIVTMDSSVAGFDLKALVHQQIISRTDLEGILYWLADVDKVESRSILEPLLQVSQLLLEIKSKNLPRLFLVTSGVWKQISEHDQPSIEAPNNSLAWGFMRGVRAEISGLTSKSIDLPFGKISERDVHHLLLEMWMDLKETEVAYRKGIRYVRRLLENQYTTNDDLIIPPRPYTVEIPNSRIIQDLKFVSTSQQQQEILASNEILVSVCDVALNFRDVFTVLQPTEQFKNNCGIGSDFSGVVQKIGNRVTRWKEGDLVFGVNLNFRSSCFKDSVSVDESLVAHLPPNMTFAQASTLPVVFCTAWHCMVNVAKIKKGQTILIHAASGGVGLMAIQIANMLGVEIIGTAGSKKKRSFVRSLGVKHVFDSRSLDYSKEIKRITGGKGVNVVLNCLTGPGFKEASLEICKDGGFFVEISKLDIWTENEVTERRPFVNYAIVDLTTAEAKLIRGMMMILNELVSNKTILPLPFQRFSACQLVQSLTYLQKAKHIGKVVVGMPENLDGRWETPLFNDRSSYLITGGKGAIGWAVCKWMLVQGAKYVVLVGRYKASNLILKEIVYLKQTYNARIICVEMDISNFEACKELIQVQLDYQELPPLRGVHHCAGVLSDKVILHQDWPSFENVLKPKVDGAWNLHKLTYHLPLEHFVLYSSATATFGHAGQSNHTTANTYLDSLAQYRHSLNLPALSVNWGRWKAGLAENAEIEWTPPFTVEEGVQALEYIMRNQHPDKSNVVAGIFELEKFPNLISQSRSAFLSDVLSKIQANKNMNKEEEVEISLLDQFREMETPQDKNRLIRNFVIKMLCETLGNRDEEISDDVEFSTMGMDSLMSIEFKNKLYVGLENNEGDDGMYIDLDEHTTLRKLTEFIHSSLDISLALPA